NRQFRRSLGPGARTAQGRVERDPGACRRGARRRRGEEQPDSPHARRRASGPARGGPDRGLLLPTIRSPRGRLIDYLEGDAEAIIARGQEITDLGEAMASSAYWLEKIKTQVECDLNGKAIETLRSSIGDAGEKL